MKKNMGIIDRAIRVSIACVIVVLYLANVISGTIAIIGLIIAGIMLATSVLSFCPLYAPFGISTCKKEDNV
ncbi:MAG: DUF2892 domain-containing protein [Cytophagales bacterium]|nr:DUF2892 domain-containing protein [Cytophagales bacterium]MDW8384728.1 DUF2892 domain-containing protein [Flammeovirgaceae bacterium]